MSKYRIMVVDDDPDVRYVVSHLLSLDFETVQANNGLDALEKFDRYEPDLLLVDVMMPVMNGFACCRSIRKRADFAEMPIFFLTASTSKETREEATAAGASAFIEKPFDTAKLIDDIRDHLYSRRVPPRMKLFTMREIEKIDATPLKAADAFDDEEDEPEATASQAKTAPLGRQIIEDVGPDGHKRTRRVFGKATPPPAPPPPPPPPTAPPAAAPPQSDSKAPWLEMKSKEDIQLGMDNYPKLPQRQAFDPDPRLISGEGFPRVTARDSDPPVQQRPGPTTSRDAVPRVRFPETAPPTREDVTRVPPTALPPPAAPPLSHTPMPVDVRTSREVARPKIEAAPPPAPPAPRAPQRTPETAPLPPAAAPPPPPAPVAANAAAGTGDSSAQAELARRRLRGMPGRGAGETGPPQLPRALVIIDAQEYLPVAAEALRGLAEFLPLEDPVEAIELIARFQPDIVVLGIRSRAYSGLDIGRMLRESPRLAHTQLLYILGPFNTPPEIAAAERLAGNPIVQIPLTAERLRAAVHAVVSKAGFAVRAKGLGYGVYVKEVLQAANEERTRMNKMLEKEAFARKTSSLAMFMARELKDHSAAPPS